MSYCSGAYEQYKEKDNSNKETVITSKRSLRSSLINKVFSGSCPENGNICNESLTIHHSSLTKIAAFTLAEILITLGIIGVVAAMTLPIVIMSYKKQVTVTKLKKEYALVSAAVQGYKSEYDGLNLDQTPIMGQFYDHKIIDMVKFGRAMAAQLKPLNQGHFNDWMCLSYGETPQYKNLRNGSVGYNTGNDRSTSYFLELKDGSCIGFYRRGYSWGDTPFGNPDTALEVIIDINGSHQKPNVIGRDTFSFYLMKDGRLLPRGYDNYNPNAHCIGKSPGDEGYHCAAKIMYEGWKITDNNSWF